LFPLPPLLVLTVHFLTPNPTSTPSVPYSGSLRYYGPPNLVFFPPPCAVSVFFALTLPLCELLSVGSPSFCFHHIVRFYVGLFHPVSAFSPLDCFTPNPPGFLEPVCGFFYRAWFLFSSVFQQTLLQGRSGFFPLPPVCLRPDFTFYFLPPHPRFVVAFALNDLISRHCLFPFPPVPPGYFFLLSIIFFLFSPPRSFLSVIAPQFSLPLLGGSSPGPQASTDFPLPF